MSFLQFQIPLLIRKQDASAWTNLRVERSLKLSGSWRILRKWCPSWRFLPAGIHANILNNQYYEISLHSNYPGDGCSSQKRAFSCWLLDPWTSSGAGGWWKHGRNSSKMEVTNQNRDTMGLSGRSQRSNELGCSTDVDFFQQIYAIYSGKSASGCEGDRSPGIITCTMVKTQYVAFSPAGDGDSLKC